MTKTLSLYELNSIVASVIDIDMSGDYWVVAEISELREVRGHCYMELVEKDELSNTPIAKASAFTMEHATTYVRAHHRTTPACRNEGDAERACAVSCCLWVLMDSQRHQSRIYNGRPCSPTSADSGSAEGRRSVRPSA